MAVAVLSLTATGARAATQERPDESLRALLRSAIEKAESFEDRFDAEVWLTDMSGRLARTVADARERIEILRHVHREAARAKLEPELVLAVIQVESNFDRFAISTAGARGLMQVMPFWLEEIGREGDNLFHIPDVNCFLCLPGKTERCPDFIHNVNCFIGQEPVIDISACELSSRPDGWF